MILCHMVNDMMACDQLHHHIAPPYCIVLCLLWFDCIDVFTAKQKGWRYVGFEGMTTTAVKLSSSHLLNLVRFGELVRDRGRTKLEDIPYKIVVLKVNSCAIGQ